MRDSHWKRGLAAGALIAGVLATAGTVALGSGSSPAQRVPSVQSTAHSVAPPAAPVDLRERLTLLRDHPATGMPTDVADTVGAPGRFGRNAALARSIETATGTGWVVLAQDGLCLVVPDPVDGYGTTCQTAAAVLAGHLEIRMMGQSAGTDTLIVPDGMHAIVKSGGNLRDVRAESGVVSVKVDGAQQLQLDRTS